MTNRCAWAGIDPVYVAYHDDEWGVPAHDDRHLFESLVLDGAQAGLSWKTILDKRAGYRAAFEGFDVQRVAEYDDAKIETLLQNPGIVRNRLKVKSAVTNARVVLDIVAEFGSLDAYLWSFVDGRTIHNAWRAIQEIPAQSAESEAMSKALKQRGMTFVGPTICYAFMQATGMVNDHEVSCFRYGELRGGS